MRGQAAWKARPAHRFPPALPHGSRAYGTAVINPTAMPCQSNIHVGRLSQKGKKKEKKRNMRQTWQQLGSVVPSKQDRQCRLHISVATAELGV